MMMRVTKIGVDSIHTAVDHPPAPGSWLNITQGPITLHGRVESVEYFLDADEIPATMRVVVVLV